VKILVAASLVCVCLAGCGSSQGGGASGSVGASTASSGGQSAARFSFAEGAIEPESSTERPAVALMLAADGSVRSSREAFGRFEANRFLMPSGDEVFHVEADGRVVAPWRQSGAGISMRYTSEGLEVTTPDGTHTLTVDDAGVYHAGANSGGGRFTPYAPALRDTVLMMRFLPLWVLSYGFAHQAAPAATPAADSATPAPTGT
jgi:hypothetical protein